MKVAFRNYLPRTHGFTHQKAVDVMAITTLEQEVEQM